MACNESSDQNQGSWQQIFLNREEVQGAHDGFLPNNWLKGVEDWWKTQPGLVAESVDSLYHKLLFSSRFFINFLDPFVASNDKVDVPACVLVNYLEIFLQSIENNRDINTKTNEKAKGFWALPFDIWQQQIGFLKSVPESFFQFADREQDDDISTESTRAYQRYLQALQNYQSAYVAMMMDAATDLMQQVQHEKSKYYTTQKICTIWIELFEKHYANFVSNDEYPHLYAEVMNSWMFLIQQTKKQLAASSNKD